MYSLDIISSIFAPWLFELINAEFMDMKREFFSDSLNYYYKKHFTSEATLLCFSTKTRVFMQKA